MKVLGRSNLRTVAGLLCLAIIAGCAVNPATGKRQLMLISEGQEIEMGQQADPEISASIGIYADDELQAYVRGLGMALAAQSERPNLPWSFKVVDDPVVNAFAVPGGFIYVTRGILATLNSEAELVGVLGHEIGHVTARHSVSQMSRMQLQQLGLGVGMILVEDIQDYAGLIQTGLGILNLKYSRGDESQSDELGVRYMTRVNYDPNALIGVFRTLALVSGGRDQRLPEWQLTHPYPENREGQIRELIAAEGRDFSSYKTERKSYIERLDGMVYGPNPREGYFKESVFLHPDLAFRLEFPAGWKGVNQRTAVGAISPGEDAMLVLTLGDAQQTPSEALSAFLGQEGIQAGRSEQLRFNGLNAARASFSAAIQDGEIRGEIAFVAYDDNLYQLLGYGAPQNWSGYVGDVRRSMESFRELRDQAALSVQPARLQVVRLPEAMSFQQFLSRYPSSVPGDEVALINHVDMDTRLESGSLVKRVIGELP